MRNQNETGCGLEAWGEGGRGGWPTAPLSVSLDQYDYWTTLPSPPPLYPLPLLVPRRFLLLPVSITPLLAPPRPLLAPSSGPLAARVGRPVACVWQHDVGGVCLHGARDCLPAEPSPIRSLSPFPLFRPFLFVLSHLKAFF